MRTSRPTTAMGLTPLLVASRRAPSPPWRRQRSGPRATAGTRPASAVAMHPAHGLRLRGSAVSGPLCGRPPPRVAVAR
eukprot:9320579-Alexandrium_andersonii.AAC.1